MLANTMLANTKLPQFMIMENNLKSLMFTLSNVDVCFANAIRRTILSDIEICCILSEHYETNNVNIEINTGRLHNEILKQRMSCIPINFWGARSEMELFCEKYKLEVDVSNEGDVMIFVTTEDFKVVLKKGKESGEVDVFPKERISKIFPKDGMSNMYIDFSRLRARISESIPGERLKLDATFSISNAKNNSMYNVVSKCTYSNTIDTLKAHDKMIEIEKRMFNQPEDVIKFEKRNFELLDIQREYIPDSFDFIIEGLGTISNIDILKESYKILTKKFENMIKLINDDKVDVSVSETTMLRSFDVKLENEDYTIGKILEYLLYSNQYLKKKILTYCGFKKFHPHDTHSIIRLAFVKSDDDYLILLKRILQEACDDAMGVLDKLLQATS
jgi:DNA-directed RNA polymerase subunit L